jgi:hypothetical protein
MRRLLLVLCALGAVLGGYVAPVQAQSPVGTTSTVPPDQLFPEAPPVEEKPVPTRADVRDRVIFLDGLARDVGRIEREISAATTAKNESEQALLQAQSVRDNRVDVELEAENKKLQELQVDKEQRKTDLQASRALLRQLASDLYMLGPNATANFTSSDPLDKYRVNQSLRVAVSNVRAEVADRQRLVDQADGEIASQQARVAEAQLAVEAANADINKHSKDIQTADETLVQGAAELTTKKTDGLFAQAGLASLLKEVGSPANVAKDPLVPIMGEPVLTPEQLTAWFAGTRGSLQVGDNNVAELAQLYIEEGRALGIRGDIAFIQAVLETGNFQYTGKNNFAGIGHCDACPRGYPFPTAREGVRAQMQLLRSYADKNIKTADLPGGAMPGINPDRLGVRGCCYSWWGLSGVWASALHYGGTILMMYEGVITYTLKVSASPAP